jgi:hypothetical protein
MILEDKDEILLPGVTQQLEYAAAGYRFYPLKKEISGLKGSKTPSSLPFGLGARIRRCLQISRYPFLVHPF